MNSIVIFFVPAGATRRDLEAALREHFAGLETGEAAARTEEDRAEFREPDKLPMWTWFLPNPCPSRS